MSNPTRSEVHVNRPLNSIAVAFIQDAKKYIADRVFPIVPSNKQSDRYFQYDRSYWLRGGAQVRAPGTPSAGSGFTVDSTPTFYCSMYSYHMDVDDALRQNADDPIDLDRDSTQFITTKMLITRDQSFISQYLAPNTWTGLMGTNSSGVIAPSDFSPSVSWSSDSSNPIADVAQMKVEIERQTGFEPNKFVVSKDINERLKQHPLIVDRIKYTQKGIVAEDILSELFGVEYLVAAAVQNTAQEGQVGVYNYMFNNKALLCYAAPNPGIMVPTAGYIFSWAGMFGGSNIGTRVRQFRMEELMSDRIEMDMAYDMKMVSSDLGILFTNCLTPYAPATGTGSSTSSTSGTSSSGGTTSGSSTAPASSGSTASSSSSAPASGGSSSSTAPASGSSSSGTSGTSTSSGG